MRIKSSLAMPSFKSVWNGEQPAEVDYDCIADIEDNGYELVVKGAYIPELELSLASHQLTKADKQRILYNLKLH